MTHDLQGSSVGNRGSQLRDDSVVLEVENLQVRLDDARGSSYPVSDMSLRLRQNETLAILGESGSGKSVTSLALMGLLNSDKFSVHADRMVLGQTDLSTLDPRGWRSVRGVRMAMVFQDPQSSLNPVQTIGAQIAEMFILHDGASRRDAKRRAIELMDRVRIPDAARRYSAYPHQFSGGMRQRVVIAIALALNPEVLIADEPTTALDVTVQARILELFRDLAKESRMGVVLITHDVGVAATVADQVNVMYAGRLVESGTTMEVLGNPSHPYTDGLLRAVPSTADRDTPLTPIPGSPPLLSDVPSGCAFHPRCPFARADCSTTIPDSRRLGGSHTTACSYSEEIYHVH